MYLQYIACGFHVHENTCIYMYMCIYSTLALRKQKEKKGEVTHRTCLLHPSLPPSNHWPQTCMTLVSCATTPHVVVNQSTTLCCTIHSPLYNMLYSHAYLHCTTCCVFPPHQPRQRKLMLHGRWTVCGLYSHFPIEYGTPTCFVVPICLCMIER